MRPLPSNKLPPILTTAPEQSRQLAERFAEWIIPGDCLALDGAIGVGKTTFVKGLASGLGVGTQLVHSPSFSLVHHYQGRLPIYHFDLYRLRSAAELAELGFSDYLQGSIGDSGRGDALGLVVVEWADRLEGVLPAERFEWRLSYVNQRENSRQFECLVFPSRLGKDWLQWWHDMAEEAKCKSS